MSTSKKLQKKQHKNNLILSEKSHLLKTLKDVQCNHMFFYEKVLNTESVKKLRNMFKPYHYKTGFPLQKQTGIEFGIKSSPNPIILHIHCPGGDIDSGFEAMKIIYKSTIPVITVIDGIVASAATFMCIIGDLRMINPHGHMLIHQPSNFTTSKGKFNTIEDKYLRIKKYMTTLKKIYKKYSTLTDKTLTKLLSQDIYLDANICKEYGLVDNVME